MQLGQAVRTRSCMSWITILFLHGRLCDRFLRNRVAQRFTEISDGWVSESKVWGLTKVFVLNLDTAVEFLFADRFMTACAILGGRKEFC